jgi:hypothetical protein
VPHNECPRRRPLFFSEVDDPTLHAGSAWRSHVHQSATENGSCAEFACDNAHAAVELARDLLDARELEMWVGLGDQRDSIMSAGVRFTLTPEPVLAYTTVGFLRRMSFHPR